MVGIYQFGMDILVGQSKYHFAFDEEIKDTNSARQLLVKMAKAPI